MSAVRSLIIWPASILKLEVAEVEVIAKRASKTIGVGTSELSLLPTESSPPLLVTIEFAAQKNRRKNLGKLAECDEGARKKDHIQQGFH